MTELSIDIHLRKGEFVLALQQNIQLQGIVGVYGHSGAGKSSLLRVIAGLECNASGTLTLGEQCWQASSRHHFVPPHQRQLAYVFQEPRLFSHLTVMCNLHFAMKRVKAVTAMPSLTDIVDGLQLTPLLTRRPATLSGGEQQRVAIARALLTAPALLLMDEPLSAIDRQHKAELIPLLRRINEQFHLPIIMVSHSADELAVLSDQLLLLRKGQAVAFDNTPRLMSRLDLLEMSSLQEAGAVLDAQVDHFDDAFQLTRLLVEGIPLSVPGRVGNVGARIKLRVHARDVAVATEKPRGLSIRNILPARITMIEEGADAHAQLLATVGQQTIRVRLTRASLSELSLVVGQSVYLLIKAASVDAY